MTATPHDRALELLVYCERWEAAVWLNDLSDLLRTELRASVDREIAAYAYAKRLAESTWTQHYHFDAPHWRPCDDLMGVMGQIDNMLTNMSRATPNQHLQRKALWLIAPGLASLGLVVHIIRHSTDFVIRPSHCIADSSPGDVRWRPVAAAPEPRGETHADEDHSQLSAGDRSSPSESVRPRAEFDEAEELRAYMVDETPINDGADAWLARARIAHKKSSDDATTIAQQAARIAEMEHDQFLVSAKLYAQQACITQLEAKLMEGRGAEAVPSTVAAALREAASVLSLGYQTGPHAYAGENMDRYMREAEAKVNAALAILAGNHPQRDGRDQSAVPVKSALANSEAT